MKRRDFIKTSAGLIAAAGTAPWATNVFADDKAPIKVGVLHSLSGTMAISETALKNTALMTFEEINAKGGVMGRKIEAWWSTRPPTGRCSPRRPPADHQDKVAAVFGCWTSVSRKSVLPVFEELNNLLFYPVQYEGEELSQNVFYTGCGAESAGDSRRRVSDGRGRRRGQALVPAGHRLRLSAHHQQDLRAFLKSKKVDEKEIEEIYTPFGHSDYQTIVANIKKFAAGGKTAVVSTINGDSNVPFYKELGNQGLKATDVPGGGILGRREDCAGSTPSRWSATSRAWNYFMSVKNAQNDASSSCTRMGQEEQRAQPGHGRDQRSDGSHLRRHPHVETGGREGQVG
jgi:urea transport system substrate-binding protein